MLKRTLAVALFVAPALFAGTLPGVTSKKLANGLEVIVIENHAVPLVTIEIAVKSGSYVEAPDYNGLSHLYEHMFFKANKAIPSAEKYQRRMNELGASWNGTTQTERVNYYITVPVENLRESTEFMRDALYFPLFNQKELERERVVVLGEFDRNEAQPGFFLSKEVDRKLWYEHFSRKNVIGDREVIATTPREKMITIKNRYYVPNNSSLLFAGDITAEEAYELAEEFFGDWKRTEDPHKLYAVPPHPPLKSSSTIAVIQPVETVTLQQAWHGPGMNADMPATFAADVFSFIIGQPTSRFHRNLIDSGAFDQASISYFSQVHTGPINFFGVTSADRFDRAYRAWQEELKHVTDANYFTDEELKFAKDQLEVSEIYGRERTSDWVHTVSFWWSTGGLKYYEDYLDNLRKVTRADINAYLKRYVIGKPSVTGVLASDADLPKMTTIKTAQVIRPAKGSSSTAMASTADTDSPTEMFEVDGVRVLLRTNKQSEVVTAKAFVEGGVAYAGPSRAGLESLAFEVAEKQSRKYPKERMARELTRLGAQLSTESGAADFTAFTLTALRRNFAESFDIFADALFHPLINDAELKLARERRLTDLAQQEEDPDAYVLRLAFENAYGSHPYALDPLGTRERISGATTADLQRIHSEISRSRVLIVVVGNVTRDEVTRVLRPALQGVPQTPYTRTAVAPIPDPDRITTRLVERDLPTVYVQGSFPAANIASADFPALYVGMNILGDRLFNEIRVKRNLSYAPAGWVMQRAANLGNVYVTTPDPNAAIKVMSDEVRKMRTTLAPEDEVADTASTVRTRLLADLQASNDIATYLGRYAIQTGDWKNFDAFLERIATVTPEEVREAMNKYAHHLDFAVLGKLEGLDRKVLTEF